MFFEPKARSLLKASIRLRNSHFFLVGILNVSFPWREYGNNDDNDNNNDNNNNDNNNNDNNNNDNNNNDNNDDNNITTTTYEWNPRNDDQIDAPYPIMFAASAVNAKVKVIVVTLVIGFPFTIGTQRKSGKVAGCGDSFAMRQFGQVESEHFHYNLIMCIILLAIHYYNKI